MKTLIIALIVATTVGCGKAADSSSSGSKGSPGPCSDVSNGNWQSLYEAGQQLALTDACYGATTYCDEVFTTHPQPNGSVILLVTATNGGPECLPMGATTCSASVDGSGMLSVNCGGGKKITANYNRF